MSILTLHYIYDPLCGWCYGASSLVAVARDVLTVRAHGGGMMTGSARRTITPDFREFVMAHDQRIAQLSGKVFGPDYFDGLLKDRGAVLDSAPPITAVLAAEELGGAGLDMLARMQTAHYVEGRRISDVEVLKVLAGELGMDADAFSLAHGGLRGPATQSHIDDSRALMARLGGRGFPTFALERDGRFSTVDTRPYLGQPEAWRGWLKGQTGQSEHKGHRVQAS